MALSISDYAQRAGVSASTVRYYEEEELLPRADRRSGKRIYDAQDVPRLKLIVAARNSGFGVKEIKSIVSSWKPSEVTLKAHIGEAVQTRKIAIEGKILELQSQRRRLDEAQNCLCEDISSCNFIS